MIRALPIILLSGCSAYYSASGRAAAQGALDDLTGPDAGARYATIAAEATRAAAGAARDELLGPETRADATALVHVAGQQMQVEVTGVVGAAGEATSMHLAAITRAEASELRLTIDGVLGGATLREVAALREELAGAPLRADVDALVDSAAPHLAAAVTQALAKVVVPVQAAADAEAGKWRPVAIAFAVGCGLLALCLGFAGWLILGHQRTIRALAARGRP